MISPTRPRVPTRTTSYIFASSSPSAMTTGPETRPTLPVIVPSLGRKGQRDAQDPLRERPDALDVELARGRRDEHDERTEGRVGLGPLVLGESRTDRLARDHEVEPVVPHRLLELAHVRFGGDLDHVREADQAEPDRELTLAQNDRTTRLLRGIGHGALGGVPAYLRATPAPSAEVLRSLSRRAPDAPRTEVPGHGASERSPQRGVLPGERPAQRRDRAGARPAREPEKLEPGELEAGGAAPGRGELVEELGVEARPPDVGVRPSEPFRVEPHEARLRVGPASLRDCVGQEESIRRQPVDLSRADA